MKVLIIRFSSIGDIVLTTPIIRCIKKQLPGAEIHFLTKEKFRDLVKNNPYISKIFTITDDTQPVLFELIKENYHYVIDLHNNLRTTYVKSILRQVFNSRVRTLTFKKLNLRKWLLTTFKMNMLPDKSIVDRYFECIRPTGVKNDGQGLDYFIAPEEEISKEDLPFSHVLGFAACAIGGQHETKKMPVDKWKEFCAALDFPVVLLGGQEDFENAERIRKTDEVKIYNACGKFSMNESAHIVQKSRFVVTHDTGLMHIAAAFQKPVISIWGNTVPAFGMFPYYGYNNLRTRVAPQLQIIENNKLSCRPCSKIGYQKCPKGHFNCMQKLDANDLLQRANQMVLDSKK
jgi:heptosyltransferase-2